MNSRRSILVRTPSRLHFGLLGFGNPNARQFGGVGVMVDRPGIELRVRSSDSFSVIGTLDDRLRKAANRWAKATGQQGELACEIELLHSPRLHTGLGVGTQLALAVAKGLNALFERECESPEELARSVGRGLRSAVGTYGFVAGGLIAEQGKLPTEVVSPLVERVELPNEWRFVLITPPSDVGLHGEHEQSAFDSLPPVPAATTEQLTAIMNDRIVPTATANDFIGFSDAVYDFGFLAGSCFESLQGSAYNGPRLTELVRRLRESGLRGVGQSSWGPTIFAICENDSTVQQLAADLQSARWCNDCDTVVAKPENHGATVTCESADL